MSLSWSCVRPAVWDIQRLPHRSSAVVSAAAVVRKLASTGWSVAMTGWPSYDKTFSWGADPSAPQQLLRDIAECGNLGMYVPADLSTATAAGDLFD